MKRHLLFAAILGAVLTAAPFSASAASTFHANTASVTPGIYEISCKADRDLVLDIRNCTVKESTDPALQLYSPLDINQQKFYLEALSGSFYRLSVLSSGDALTAPEAPDDYCTEYTGNVEPSTSDAQPSSESSSEHSSSQADSDAFVQDILIEPMLHPEDLIADLSQIWCLEEAGGDYWYIHSAQGQYLTLGSTAAHKGASVILKPFDGSARQKWKLNKTWISSQDTADTDLVNPYDTDGAYSTLNLVLNLGKNSPILTASDFSQWMKETEEHTYTLDEESLTAYVSQLADTYNTIGESILFTTSQGTEISVSSVTLGWELDVEQTKEQLLQSSQSRGLVVVEPIWICKGGDSPGQNAIGDSYVEVNLSQQKVWLYKDGELLLETNCVSGTHNTDRQTPEGAYRIYYRQSPAVLNGPGYSSPVEYWMAFYHGYGLHDANWRSSFGGDIYLTNGSHGCVNLPTEAARQIYETTDYGYPVICYY